jgi:hypothetical protein
LLLLRLLLLRLPPSILAGAESYEIAPGGRCCVITGVSYPEIANGCKGVKLPPLCFLVLRLLVLRLLLLRMLLLRMPPINTVILNKYFIYYNTAFANCIVYYYFRLPPALADLLR